VEKHTVKTEYSKRPDGLYNKWELWLASWFLDDLRDEPMWVLTDVVSKFGDGK